MKNYTEVIEYIETVLKGNGIEIILLKDAIICGDYPTGDGSTEAVARVGLTVSVPLRCIPDELIQAKRLWGEGTTVNNCGER